MSEHTLGPWTTRETQEHWGRINVHVNGPDDLELACVYQRTSSENKANARLIAAAPDLLAALKECITAVDVTMYGMAIHNARAAIAKATGDQP